MKGMLLLLSVATLITACNNQSKDPVAKADSMNEVKEARADTTGKPIITTDKETTDFLVQAADGGMLEVQLAQMAQQKSAHAGIKAFGTLLFNDHSAAYEQVKTFATQRNVTLATQPGKESEQLMDELMKKNGADFDQSYIKAMVKDHEKDIRLFKAASDKVNDTEVKIFIDNMIPRLQHHLDSARSIQKKMR